MQYILCNLPKVFQKVRTWRQILISQQNSIFGGLKFLCEFKLFGEGPSGFRTTSAILLLNNHYFLPIVRRSPPWHSPPQTFTTPSVKSDVHHPRHSPPQTFTTSDIHHPRHSSQSTFVVWLAKTYSNEHSIQVKLQMRIIQLGEFTKIFLNSFICLFHILLIRLQWCTQAFPLLSMFDCFKYHQPLLGLPSTALVQGCLDCRNILNAWTVGEFFFWGWWL